MRTYQATAILLMVAAMLVASCGPEAEISYKPPLIPIKVSVNSSGEVSVGLSHSLETPIGTFDIGAGTTIYSIRQNSEKRLLIVRVDDEVTVYELVEGKGFEVSFGGDESLYRQVNLTHESDGDIVLELESADLSQRDVPQPPADDDSQPVVDERGITELLERWDTIHHQADRYWDTTSLDSVLRGDALRQQQSTIEWLRDKNCYWVIRDLATPHITEFDVVSADSVTVEVYKSWDMDLYCNDVKEKDDDGPFTMRYNIERIDGQWYITWKQNIGTF